MKSVLVAVLAVFIVGCSSTPSNKELNARMDAQGRMINTNSLGINANNQEIRNSNDATDEKIDRAFKKSQMK